MLVIKCDQFHSPNGIVSFQVKEICHILGNLTQGLSSSDGNRNLVSFLFFPSYRKNLFQEKLWTGMSVEFDSASVWMCVVLYAENG